MMPGICSHKLILFGAGRIGRSFIGQLFSRAGYEVVFVDINETLIRELNRRHSYMVIHRSDTDIRFDITNVRGVLAGDRDMVVSEVATAGILAVSVGQAGLPSIFPALAGGLMRRQTEFPGQAIDLIIAENMRDADVFFRSSLASLLPRDYPMERMVGLVESSIGKMVPILTQREMEEDPLRVIAEPYNTLILDARGFRNPIPDVPGLAPKNNMKAWVDRKLFIHNLGHATAAYIGYLKHPDYTYMWELLADREIFDQTRAAMLEAAAVLMALYPAEFTGKDLTDHIDDLLTRFQNKMLGDTVFRVGCDL